MSGKKSHASIFLGNLLRHHRGAAGLRETSRRFGLDHATYLRLEAGYQPSFETFLRVLPALSRDELSRLVGVVTQSVNHSKETS